jgi:Tfp pilus assembly protein PilN
LELSNLLAFGMGVGIEIRGADLDITVARVRPNGAAITAHGAIARFRERKAGDWGGEYSDFLKKHGVSHLTAAVVLPPGEVVVRGLTLAGIGAKDLPGAVDFQIDGAHPFGDAEVASGWTRVGAPERGGVLLGVALAAVVEKYARLFTEAGVAVSSFTFAASAVYAAVRLFRAPVAGFVAWRERESGEIEIYGESPARPVFWAEFDLPRERAAALAAAELRMEGAEGVPLASVLPLPRANPAENDLSRNAASYAAALSCACPRLAPAANLLPVERRSSHSRAMLIPAAVLSVLAMALGAAWFASAALEQRRYLQAIEAEIAKVEPAARRAAALDKEIETTGNRIRAIAEFREQVRKDLGALNELSRILPPGAWASSVEISRETALIAGDTDSAAPLLEVLDASPEFRNSEFASVTRVGNYEVFRIRTVREGARK